MQLLYRVVDKNSYESALKSGLVPRCNSDERSNLVHLNTKNDVELVASTYFEKQEVPVVLEINSESFVEQISWHEPTANKPWLEVRAKIKNINMNHVTAIYELSHIESSDLIKFKIGNRI